MEKILAGIDRTKNFIGKTVKEQNPNIILDFFKNKGKTIGVKDTKEIDNKLIKKLLRNGYIWNTIDFSSDRGRAIDIRLLNPITSKVMTGSSSGTAINVLYGLNTVGIGTDGGGSVLGPAISLNLYSALLSGMGLKGKNEKKSTDEIVFTAGIGFITQNFVELEKVLKIFYEESEKKLKKLVLSDTLEKEIEDKLKNNYEITIWKDRSLFSREELMTELNNIFQKGDVFIYVEKNIEVEGIGDSVLGSLGDSGKGFQENSNKKFLKVFNMLDCTAITIPLKNIGSSIVIATPKGKNGLKYVLEIGKILDYEYRPKLFQEYFLNYPLKRIDNRTFEILEEM